MDQQIMISSSNNNNKQQHHKNDNNMLRRLHRDSQTILSKNKPQVRIIHIFAPEIIKTDPANFRELVQRLTGKPTMTSREKLIRKRNSDGKRVDGDQRRKIQTVKSEEEAEIWRTSSSSGGSGDYESGGFLTGFADMEDGFMQELGLFQPSLDLIPQNHNQMLMHHQQQHPYRHHQNQQQQHHFFGGEDHTHNYRVL